MGAQKKKEDDKNLPFSFACLLTYSSKQVRTAVAKGKGEKRHP